MRAERAGPGHGPTHRARQRGNGQAIGSDHKNASNSTQGPLPSVHCGSLARDTASRYPAIHGAGASPNGRASSFRATPRVGSDPFQEQGLRILTNENQLQLARPSYNFEHEPLV